MKAKGKAHEGVGKRHGSRRGCLIGLGACIVGGVTAIVVWDDRWDLQVERVTVTLARLDPRLDGFTIGHLSDLHRGRYVPEEFVKRAADAVMAARPDLIVLTGDSISHRPELGVECARALAALSAPCGNYAVLGNHEYWTDAEEVTRHLTEGTAFQVLGNESILIFDGGAELAIVGLDDPVTGHDDFDAALAHVPADVPVVMLAHSPEVVREAARRRIDLVLAGHTHGGQIVLPGLGPPVLPRRVPRRFAMGLQAEGDTQVYVSRGVGMAVIPVRMNCPPEVAIITLRSGK